MSKLQDLQQAVIESSGDLAIARHQFNFCSIYDADYYERKLINCETQFDTDKEAFDNFVAELESNKSNKSEQITALIHELVADINTRALRKHKQGSAWTLEDCRQGANLGRSIAEKLNDLFK